MSAMGTQTFPDHFYGFLGAMWYLHIYIPRRLMHPSDCYGAVGFIASSTPFFRQRFAYTWRFSKVFGDKSIKDSKERARRSKTQRRKKSS